MSKKDPILAALGECPEKWNDFLLKTYRFPQDPFTRKEVQQDCIRVLDQKSGRLVPMPLGEAGESTTQSDALTSLHQEAGADESVALSPQWLLHLEYMDVIAEELYPKDKDAALKLKQLALADARSRYWEQPPEVFRPMNASLGTPAEFRERWFYGELEIRVCAADRRNHVFEIWRLPPAEPEDLDEAGEPSGHWDGLKWTPDTEISGS